MDNGTHDVISRKVFFLYPPPSVERSLDVFLEHEFEVYLVKDHVAFREILSHSGESILFINFDAGLDIPGWQRYIHDIIQDPKCSLAAVRGLTTKESLLASFTSGGGRAGEEVSGFDGHDEESLIRTPREDEMGILVDVLDAMGARGRRKHLRAHDHAAAVRCRLDSGESRFEASIVDLSVAGMAALVDEAGGLGPETALSGISLELAGIRVETRGIVATTRRDAQGRPVCVIMFAPSTLEGQTLARLRAIVRELHQREMDLLLKSVSQA